ncbi:lanthionine synthetase LanC family protein [Streptomyces sp. c-19]|uniref:lanthionine synthetase LanC family protein n=1 Tax=Streptomyces sp. c-19 TaxID=2789275 RepID=UPI00397F01B5
MAARVADRQRLSETLAASASQTQFPGSAEWLPYAVAGGDAGIAVMCSYLDQCRPGQGWDRVGHGFLATGTEAAQRATAVGPGLFSGLSSVAFAAASLSRKGSYRRALVALAGRLGPSVPDTSARLCSAQADLPVSDFDLISGASGAAAHLLVRDPHGALPYDLSLRQPQPRTRARRAGRLRECRGSARGRRPAAPPGRGSRTRRGWVRARISEGCARGRRGVERRRGGTGRTVNRRIAFTLSTFAGEYEAEWTHHAVRPSFRSDGRPRRPAGPRRAGRSPVLRWTFPAAYDDSPVVRITLGDTPAGDITCHGDPPGNHG